MIFLLIVVIFLAYICYIATRPLREHGRYPPGPSPLPVLGNLLMFKGSKKATFDDALLFNHKYGDDNCVTVWFGMKPNIIINTLNGVREAFIDNQLDFASRPDMSLFLDLTFEGTPDIIFGEFSENWQAMKKLGAKVLRRVIDSNKLESNVTEATDKLVAAFEAEDLSQPIAIHKFTTNCVYSILAALCFGEQYSMDDPKFVELLELRQRNNDVPAWLFLIALIPGVKKVAKLLEFIPAWKKMLDDNIAQMKFLQAYIDEHKATREERRGTDLEMRDVLDALHAEQEEAARSEEKLPHLTDSAAKMIIFDIFGAGTETTAATLRWFVLEMALNPDIQEACADQINTVVGNGIPSLEDRPQLPLVEAALLETLRLHPPAPLAVGHAPTRPDALLFGKYPVPMDTVLMYNIWAIHRDPKLYPEPYTFDPARYIESEKVYKPIGWIPFGVGRRVCMGETLAKNDMFLVCTGLLQRLRFKTAPGEDYTRYPEVTNGLTNLPRPDMKFLIEVR